MLFDLIRDFFVMHVFGGMTSTGELIDPIVGGIDDYNIVHYGNQITYAIGYDIDGSNPIRMTLCDWLSTTTTIISITIIVVLCCMFVYKIVKLIGGLIR